MHCYTAFWTPPRLEGDERCGIRDALAFRTATDQILTGNIAELDYQRLGGIDQWVTIRGAGLTNPAVASSAWWAWV